MFLHNFARKNISAAVNHYNSYLTVITFHNFTLKYFLSFLKAETLQN
jgi:hypothetical protein